VLAELRRARTRRPRRAVEIRRCPQPSARVPSFGGATQWHVDHAAGGMELLVSDDIFDGVDR